MKYVGWAFARAWQNRLLLRQRRRRELLRATQRGDRHPRWPSPATARTEIFTFIETFYNRKRLWKHPAWGYLTPLEIRQRHEQGQALAA
ncbi:hypothetical protein [Streptomyces gobiensis]|uniref:hypothetical protein n=1 Tax=Streptomyces gobiensis TaxID=2875706 RepID=UPI001E5193B4|nr:hypothetical protein [Streptomyces gobiensis]UGY91010.1 hypothetical protein test1122_04240 [Streptomyces gobiensis]